MTVICQHCGATLPPIAMFCGECGRSVAARGPVVPPVALTSSAIPFSASEPLSITPATPPEPEERTPDGLALPASPARPAGPAHAASPAYPGGPVQPVSPAHPVPTAAERLAAAIRPDPSRCPRCGTPAEPDDLYCGTCGEPLASGAHLDAPPPAPGQAPAPPARAPSAGTAPSPPWPGASAPASSETDGGLEPDTESTRLVPRGSTGARFVLQFSTGESYTVVGSGIIGRNPHPEPGEAVDHIVTIVDPGRSVSKSHLEFGQDNGVFWVSDRHSGNGSVIREPGSEPRYCEPGRRYRVVRGTRIDIGEQFVIVS